MQLNITIPGLFNLNKTAVLYLSKELNCLKLNKFLKHCKTSTYNYSYSDLIMANQYDKLATISLATTYAKNLGIYKDSFSYLLAEPTHLKADRHRLLIWDDLNYLSKTQATNYIDKINSHFNKRAKFYYINNKLWLVELTNPLILDNLHPLVDIIAQDMDDNLPTGIDALNYSVILNEIQMLLYSLCNPINQPANSLNSLWLWDKAFCNDINLAAICKVAINSANLEQLNPSIKQLPRLPLLDDILGYDLIILDNLYYPSCYNDSQLWLTSLNELDNYLANLIEQALTYPKLTQLNIYIPDKDNTTCLHITKFDKYKFWQKSTTLIDLIKDTHEK